MKQMLNFEKLPLGVLREPPKGLVSCWKAGAEF